MLAHRKSVHVARVGLTVIASAGMWLAGCVPPPVVVFSILGGIFLQTFLNIGPIETRANETVKVPTAVRLFQEAPRETPPTGQMTLPGTSVGVAHRLTGKTIAGSQALPLNGSATIRFNIAAGASATLCDSAIFLAEFELTLTSGVAAIRDEVFDLSQEAIRVMQANDVTICIEITADFDGQITIGEYFLSFGGGEGGDLPPSAIEGPAILPGGGTQIPIDSRGGRAVTAPINRTISGVGYGVVGVLEAQTPAVTSPTTEPSTITVVPAELGLITADTLYIGTHSSFVPDVAGGVKLATLTVSYTTGGAPTTLDFVTGSTTAEWSYDRPAHTVAYGGVQHAQAPVLYSFDTMIDSTTVYKGYSYSVALPVDSSRTISSLSLSMADPATYAMSRLETGALAGWAGQAITAITLAGRALVIPDAEACCAPDTSCTDLTPDDCLAIGNTPQGEGTACITADCGTLDEPEACCLPPAVVQPPVVPPPDGYVCRMIDGEPSMTGLETRADCLRLNGIPQGTGTTCERTTCPEFYACCFEPTATNGYTCEMLIFDECVERGGDPQAFGVLCSDEPCPAACCFVNGTCLELDPETCDDADGLAGPPGSECDFVECLGACCKPDGTCELLTVEQCDMLSGEHQGVEVDCAPDTCLGGCCFDDTLFCFGDLTADACRNTGGTPLPNCEPDTLDPCQFACCLPDGTCDEGKTVDECEALGGAAEARGTRCQNITCPPIGPTRWVLAETQVNPTNADSDSVGTGRFEGTFIRWSETTNSLTLENRDVDNGFENYNVTVTATFPTPPGELIPGELVELSVTFTGSGEVIHFNPGIQFSYWVDNDPIHPGFGYQYFPWNPNSPDFGSDGATTFSFTVPSVAVDGEVVIDAFLWNCSECNVAWIYRPE